MIEADTVVLGAGMTGLVVASQLADAGDAPIVLEKSRGTGGRIATKRVGGLRFDHGAQYMRPRGPEFSALLDRLSAAGAVESWPEIDGAPGFVGRSGMSAALKPLAEGVDIRCETEVAQAVHDGTSWLLRDGAGMALARATRLVSTIPAPQAARVLAGHPLTDALDAVMFDPCWTLMIAFAEPLALPPLASEPAQDLAWVACDSSRPGRPAGPQSWVVQAGPDWSQRHLDDARDDVVARLSDLLRQRLGAPLPPVVHATAHRWRYARASVPLGRACLSDPATHLVIAGDWCLGDRAEHGFLSAQAALAALSVVPAVATAD